MSETISPNTAQSDLPTPRAPEHSRWFDRRMPCRSYLTSGSTAGRLIAIVVMTAFAHAMSTAAVRAVTFDEVIVRPPLSATPLDLVATDETPGQEVLNASLVRFEQTPPGFRSSTIFLLEPPNATNEGTPFNAVDPRFPPNTSDALTIVSDASFPFVQLFFISDGATPLNISNFFIEPLGNRFTIVEDGTLQDVSAFFGMQPGTVLVGSDVAEPNALLLLATALTSLLAYGWRRSQSMG